MNQDNFYKLVSGRRTDAWAILFRRLMPIAATGCSLVIRLRNILYSKGLLKTHQVNATVLSVGNITVGGTGKTPLVVWLCNLIAQNSKLKTQNYKCAILTRGYKTKKEIAADEVAILAESCPQAKVIVNPNRVAGAVTAVSKFAAKVLIMDDGFQHRRLARDLDIVTIDATQPFGYGKILPAGLLREPVTSLKRADAVVITRCDQIAEHELDKLEKTLLLINPDIVIAKSIHAVVHAKNTDNKELHCEQLKGKKIFAFCGIGNPDAFLNTVTSLGSELIGSKIFNDHHRYTQACLVDIYKKAKDFNADMILTTQKDWTKIALLDPGKQDVPLLYLAIKIKFPAGADELTALIEKALIGKIPHKQKYSDKKINKTN